MCYDRNPTTLNSNIFFFFYVEILQNTEFNPQEFNPQNINRGVGGGYREISMELNWNLTWLNFASNVLINLNLSINWYWFFTLMRRSRFISNVHFFCVQIKRKNIIIFNDKEFYNFLELILFLNFWKYLSCLKYCYSLNYFEEYPYHYCLIISVIGQSSILQVDIILDTIIFILFFLLSSWISTMLC